MFKKMLFLLLGLSLFSFTTEIKSLDGIRENYEKAAEDEDVCDAIFEYLKTSDFENDPLLCGYLGALQTIRASYAFNPYAKLNLFKAGVKDLEAAIKLAPNNVELRYLRYTVQLECPSFLGYSDQQDDDKKVLVDALENNLHEKDKKLAVRIKNYLVNSDECTADELERIPSWN